MKNNLKRVICLMLCAALTACGLPLCASGDFYDRVSFTLTGGMRYAAPENRDSYSDAFMLDALYNDLQYAQLDGLTESAFALVRDRAREGAEYLLVAGAMTYNGEYENHTAIASKLRELEESSGVKVIVAPGPGDIYNLNSAVFRDGKRIRTLIATTPSQFRSFYSQLGRDLADAVYSNNADTPGSCSYAVTMGSIRLIVIDATYFSDTILSPDGDRSVTGRIDEKTMAWIKSQCDLAKRGGQTPVGLCGWDLTGGGLSDDGVLENAQSAAAELADAGMHFFLSAGSGRNDVSSVISRSGEIIYNVQTAHLTSFPNTLRTCDFEGGALKVDVLDVDASQPVVSSSYEGHESVTYEKPYRQTASLRVQYCDYDMARYFTEKFRYIMEYGVIPGIESYKTIEAYLQAALGVDANEYINNLMGGGIDIFGYVAVFDSTNVLNLLNNSILPQLKDNILANPGELYDTVYDGLKTVCEAEVSSVVCTEFLDTYGFGSVNRGGSYGELYLSLVVTSRVGNEDISSDKFLTDVGLNLQSGALVPYIARVLGIGVGKEILLDGILADVTVQPEYLLFLDDTEGSLGGYIQTGFKYFMDIYRREPTYSGLFYALISSRLLKSTFGAYGSTPEEVLDTYIEKYFSGSRAEAIGDQLYEYYKYYTVDTDPKFKGDVKAEYIYSGPVEPDPERVFTEAASRVTVTYGANPQSDINISWYTSLSSTASDIELYEGSGRFLGNYFLGAAGAKADTDAYEVKASYKVIDIGVAGFGNRTQPLMRHVVKLTGLKKGTGYVCRVGDAEASVWSGDVKFKTASDSNKLTFAHVTETAGISKSDYALSANVFDCIGSLYPKLDFIVHTGNFTVGGSDYKQWESLLNTSSVTSSAVFVPVNGTAERGSTAVEDNFIMTLPEGANAEYYSLDAGNARIVVLDSNRYALGGDIPARQAAFLREKMSDAEGKWKILALHGDVYTSAVTADNNDHASYMSSITALCDELGIDIVLTGSEGVYARTDSVLDGKVEKSPRISYEFGGKYYRAIVSPAGTVYCALSPSGSAASDAVEYKGLDPLLDITGAETDPALPAFTAYEIDGDNLLLKTYTLDGKQARVIDSMLIKRSDDSPTKGDVDSDGKITSKDARLALRISAALERNVTERMKQRADLDGNGRVNASEARRILRYSAKLEKTL